MRAELSLITITIQQQDEKNSIICNAPMPDPFLLASDGMLPMAPLHSLQWTRGLVWLFLLSNSLIALSFFALLSAIALLIRRRADVRFGWRMRLVSSLIFSIGIAYMLEIWSIWHPNLWLEGIVDALIGVLMLTCTTILWRMMPAFLAIPNPRELETANRELQNEIAERNRTERSLRASEMNFRSMLDGVRDYAILMLDPEGHVTTWNHAAQTIKGYSAEEIMGQHFSIFYPEEAREEGMPQQLLDVARSVGRCEDDNWRVRKDGTRFWANVIITAMRDPEGKLHGFLKVTRDMTERRRMEEVTRLNIELSRSNEELRQFAKIAAHDLQEPLRAIEGYASLIDRRYKGKLDKDFNEFIEFIIDGSSRMADQIQSVLVHSRVRTEEKELALIDCHKVLKEVIVNLKLSIQESQTRIQMEELPTIVANRAELVQLFQNLLSNAIKFRREESPLVRVSATEDDEYWKFCVEDNGIGISPRYTEKIFSMFSRLHSRSRYSGTGIGLAICQKIVESHGGKIWCESKSKSGSKFFFTLPKDRSKGRSSDDAKSN